MCWKGIFEEEDNKVSLIQQGDGYEIKYAGTSIVKHNSLDLSYGVLYNYCLIFKAFTTFYENDIRMYLQDDKIMELSKLYLLGRIV